MHGSEFLPSPLWVIPFVVLLLSIALLPLAVPRFWHSSVRKLVVALACGLPVAVLYVRENPTALVHVGQEYVSFIILLGSLFVISGGILLTGDLPATPRVNTTFLGVGAFLASFIGTTGAAMLLIRPVLSTNSERKHVVHTVVFFIFLVANVGGTLTPLGDPPLFLGYLRGVPFTWTFRLLPEWLAATSLLLLIYYLWDRRAYAREEPKALLMDRVTVRPLRLAGRRNVLLLAGVVASVAFLAAPWRELAMLLLAGFSMAWTPSGLRRANHFTFAPIIEVAVLFVGIFAAMVPALDLLRAHGAELHVHAPWHFFWTTGLLSSFLDNAPTYLTFLALGQGLGLTPEVVGMTHEVLRGISLGAVFMGANTYIGNGPNFMVRVIAEERGVPMPSFGGYMLYSGAVLIPVFVVLTFIFLR